MNALKVTETDRNSQTYIRTSVTTFLISSPPPPLAPCSASSLNFFSSEIHSSRVLCCCFVLPFPVCGCDDDLRATLLCTTQLKIFLCEENLHNNNAKENKNSEDGQQQGKRIQKFVKICAHYLMQGTDVVRTTRTMIASLVILSTRKLWTKENDGKSRF